MTRLSITIPQPSGETIVKQEGISQQEVEEIFLPSAPKVTITRLFYPEFITEIPNYRSLNYNGGIAFTNYIFFNWEKFYYISYYDPSGWMQINIPYECKGDFIFFLNDKGEFYRINFRTSKGFYEDQNVYSAILDQTDDSPNQYISQPLAIKVLNKGLTGTECTITYSQTLFNNDDKIEYIGYKYGNPQSIYIEKDRDGDNYIDCKETTEKLSIVGLTVRNTDNENLYTFDFPSGYSLIENADITLLDMNKYRHLIVNVTDTAGTRYMLIYRIDPETSSIEQVGQPMKARVAPTVVSRGYDVTVELPENQGDSNITVTSMNGQTILTRQVPAGGGHTAIPTNSLPQGMNIVTVTDMEQGSMESNKIIVK